MYTLGNGATAYVASTNTTSLVVELKMVNTSLLEHQIPKHLPIASHKTFIHYKNNI